MTLASLNMFLFACLALIATAVEEKRILLNDPDLIHSEITAMQHQIQEMNSKLQDQQNKLLAQERLITEIQTKTQSGNNDLLCILAIELRHCCRNCRMKRSRDKLKNKNYTNVY